MLNVVVSNNSFWVNRFPNIRFWQDLQSGKWEYSTIRTIDQFVDITDTVLDIGCSFGPLTLYLACKSSKVLAFDPDPIMFRQLLRNIELNPSLKHKIIPRNYAINTADQKIALFARKQYGMSSSSILDRVQDNIHSHYTEGYTLKSILAIENIQNVDFIKMDIEGGEFLVLPHLENSLNELNLPKLFISFHSNYLNEYLLRTKQGKGWFAYYGHIINSKLNWKIYRKEMDHIIRSALSALQSYPKVFSSDGEELDRTTLFKNPSQIGNRSILFTK